MSLRTSFSSDKKFIFLFFIVFLLSPYVLLFGHWTQSLAALQSFDWEELRWALKNSFTQSFFSSFLAFILGLFLFFGLGQCRFWWPENKKLLAVTEFLVLAPSFLPALFLILVVMSFVQPFPIGLIGVSLLHALMNAGLVAVMLDQLYQEKVESLAQVAIVFGAKKSFFVRRVFPLIVKDLFAIFIFVFILCFASFSVPMIAGGGNATTLEILIYEKIRFSGQWGSAVLLSLLQLLFIFVFTLNPFKTQSPRLDRPRSQLIFFRGIFSFMILLSYCFLFSGYFLWQSFSGFDQLMNISGLITEALSLIPSSLFLALSVGFVVLFLLLLSAWGAPNYILQKWISGMASPSTSLLGLALLLMPFPFAIDPMLKWTVGFAYLIFSTVYRWGWQQALAKINSQIQMAELMGADNLLIYKKIIFPQMFSPACRLAGIASFWAVGDFALGKLLLPQDVTLSLLIESLLSSYRLNAAMALMSLLLVLGVCCYLFFWSLQFVYSKARNENVIG